MIALQQAHRLIGWQENLTEEEMPPQWMWPLEHELEIWFDEVKRAREDKYGRGRDTEVPMMENEYAEQMRRR